RASAPFRGGRRRLPAPLLPRLQVAIELLFAHANSASALAHAKMVQPTLRHQRVDGTGGTAETFRNFGDQKETIHDRYLCLFNEGGAYLSNTHDGDTNQAIELEERGERCSP